MSLFLRLSIVLAILAVFGASILICYLGVRERTENINRIIGDRQELAATWRNMGNYDEALQILNETLFEYPYDWSTYLYRAQIYSLKGNYDKAMLDCNKSISIQDKYVYMAYSARSFVYSDKKEWDKAISDLNEALRRCPNESILSALDIKPSDIRKRLEEVRQLQQGGAK